MFTIEQLENNRKSKAVWVLNNTSGSTRSQVIISMKGKDGSAELLLIPQTFIPVNLAMQAPKAALLDSSEFRRALNKQDIKLLSPEEAEEMLEAEGAEEEILRIQQISRRNNELNQNLTSPALTNVNSNEVRSEVQLSEDKVSTAVMQLATQIEELDDITLLNSVRSLGSLTIDDYKYIGRRSGNFPKTQTFLKSKVNDLRKSSGEFA